MVYQVWYFEGNSPMVYGTFDNGETAHHWAARVYKGWTIELDKGKTVTAKEAFKIGYGRDLY